MTRRLRWPLSLCSVGRVLIGKKNPLLSSVGALRVFFPAAKFLFGEKAWPASERGKGRDLVLLLKLLIILDIYWKVLLFVYMSVIPSESDFAGKCWFSFKWSTHTLTSKTSSGSPLASSYCWELPSSSPLPWDGAHHPWDQQLCREVLSPSRSAP